MNNEIFITNSSQEDTITLFDIRGRQVNILNTVFDEFGKVTRLVISNSTAAGLYILNINAISTLIVIKG